MANDAFGETGKYIIYQLLLNGKLSFAQMVVNDDGLEKCFIQMLRKRFIIKCDAQDCATVKDQLMAEEADIISQQGSVITPTAMSNLKKKLKEKRMAEQAEAEKIGLKRKRANNLAEMTDQDFNIYEEKSFYRVNLEQFHMHFRDLVFKFTDFIGIRCAC